MFELEQDKIMSMFKILLSEIFSYLLWLAMHNIVLDNESTSIFAFMNSCSLNCVIRAY